MPSRALELRGESPRALEALDLVVGGTAVAVAKAREPSFLPERLRPGQVMNRVLSPMVRLGSLQRRRLTFEAVRQLDVVLPPVADLLMRHLPLAALLIPHV